ncbi:MAG TPA: FAD/NAD(P)-binding oxidoreductase [Pseudonocardiaceae bacterium]|jgi:phthalate 3,4-dioxygenase ferredoxin reductase subunit|nr:FAD/NAD(P)-binding oxidoreductase [Pseudonocardiaceae bacterium]
MKQTTVVVGASIGGVRTAQGLRSAGYDGEIVLIGDEAVPPYDKPPLSKAVLAGTAPATELLTESAAAQAGITLLLGRAARQLDLAAGRIVLADGEPVSYDSLVIATGARARPSPWAGAPGVHVLRTLADADRLRADLRGGGPLIVVGAGFIGAEVAATARAMGVTEVTLVDPVPVPMSRALSPEVAQRMATLHRDHGVRTRFGTGVVGIDEHADELVVRLADGSALPARVVVVGIGAVPNDDWLAGSGLVIDDGVICDPHCQAVRAAGVYAVGDVARWHHPRLDRTVRVEHWTNAVEQARCVAHNIARPAERRAHDSVEYVWSDQYDWKIQLAGRTGDGLAGVLLPGPGDSFAVLYPDGDQRLTGAVTVNWPRALVAARRAITARDPLDQVGAAIGALR